MQLDSELVNGVLLVRIDATRIDATRAIDFKDQMRKLTAEAPARVVLDLAQIDFVDSSGLGAIVASMKALGPDQKLDLAALSPTVAKVFHLTRMDTVFDIHETVDGALSGLERAG